MKIRTLVLAAGVVGGLSQTGDAFVPRKGADAPFVATGRAPRSEIHAAYVNTTLAQHGLDRWHAVWDVDTDVPVRMWGSTTVAAGTVANPAAAEAYAREFLATHLRLLAPGASVGDFTLVSNQLSPSGDLRSVGFEQRIAGVRVLDSGIGFAFKNDRLVMVNSSAKPNVAVVSTTASFKPHAIKIAATGWLATGGLTTKATAVTERVIVPIVRPRVRAGLDITYRLADTVEVESIVEHDKWSVWVGADDGVPFARATRLMHTTGTVLFSTPDQSPSGTRSAKPAPFDTHTVNGQATLSDGNGVVTWNTATAATVNPGLSGTLVRVVNAAGAQATATLTLAPAGMVTWDRSAVGTDDAQLSSFVFANKAKAFAKANYNPTLPFIISQQLEVNVNVDGSCNAFWDPQAGNLNFYPADSQCENTGRMADVVYHEFGHGLHQNSVIPGVGQFDGGLSEGLADTNAVAITGDSGLGRGFFFTNAPLRELNPTVKKVWMPGLEVHDQGEIIGETLWDLRTALQTKMGTAAGYAHFLKIYYSIMQRASDIPTTTYPEALAADDDDGDLTNGTPNECEINAAFAAHEIADMSLVPGLPPPTRDNFTVTLSVAASGAGACPGPDIESVAIAWHLHGTTSDQTVTMTKTDDKWTGDIPTQPDGTVIEYQVQATRADSSIKLFPQNIADPYYQMYVGNVTTLWCADFETGATDWTHSGMPAASDEWQAGVPMGLGGDPKDAHGGTGVFGIDLTNDGAYAANATITAKSPMIDLMGHTNARLQLYRWLGVEDGFYDHATISVNGIKIWTNKASPSMPTAEINHRDNEWRFQDFDLSSESGMIQLAFGLQSDEGLQFGGWTLDDVCVVVPGPPTPVCGNNIVEDGEMCDDGNNVDGDGCSATCVDEHGHGGGCCSTGTGPAGPLSLGIVVVGLLLRRRRR